jgi:hypothetical protein
MAALLASAAMSAAAFAATQPTGQTEADHDFTKLSTEGLKAMQDVRLARVAIFEAQPDQAKQSIADAETAIAKAKTDETAYMKAESQMTPPPGTAKPGATPAQASTTPITWIPVDGGLTINEDYTASSGKSAGVAKANQQLKQGNAKEAMEALKLAQVDAVFVAELAPLDKTTAGIDKAAQEIDAGQYYQANQTLKSVEDGVRFDAIDVTGVPKKTAGNMAATKPSSGTPSAAGGTSPAGGR